MNAAAAHSREQTLAGGLAFAVHVLLLIMLVFGVSWQHKQVDNAVVVDLWRDLPAAAPPKVEPPPVAKPEPPPPAPKVEVKPPPRPEPAPKSLPKPEPVPKPDIALKEKLEKERKLKEQQEAEAKKLAAELEKKKRAEADALKKKQATETEVLKKKQAADAAAKSLAAEEQKARDALAAQQAAAAQNEIDKYMSGIRNKVKPLVRVPPGVQGNPKAEVEVEVTLLPGGDVLDVRISKSSGNAAYDAAVESAIRKAQPLVVPTGEPFQRYFRRLTMAFRPVQ